MFFFRTTFLTAALVLLAAPLTLVHAQSLGGGGSLNANADLARRLELAGLAVTYNSPRDAIMTSNLSTSPMFSQVMARMDMNKVNQQAAQLMAQTFTVAELQALVAFQSSAAGRSLTEKMPSYQKMLGALIQNEMAGIFQSMVATQGGGQGASGIQVNAMPGGALPAAPGSGGTPLRR